MYPPSHMRKKIKNLDARPRAASGEAAVGVPIENANFSEISKFKKNAYARRVPVESLRRIFIL